MRRGRGLALGVLIGAGALAVLAFPVRATWWGGWILTMAEAGIVGGLADWFAVTALFRRPLGLPIPHTALIPANWEALATRVGAMVGGRVLTKDYVRDEIVRLDVAGLIVVGARRVRRSEIDTVTRAALLWLADAMTPKAAGEALGRLGGLLEGQPVAPLLADALRVARVQGWEDRALAGALATLATALERPQFRQTVGDVIDDLLARYRERMRAYPRLLMGIAIVLGVVDRERIVATLAATVRHAAADAEHPVREGWREGVHDLERRLAEDAALAARVERVARDLLASPALADLAQAAAEALHRALVADLHTPRSEAVAWVAARLERARQALVDDAALRHDIEAWLKASAVELLERHHGRVARFIENGVRALGPEGAVRLIEEHAGEDLQYIRVNGTVVGGLAGGAIYALHLIWHLL